MSQPGIVPRVPETKTTVTFTPRESERNALFSSPTDIAQSAVDGALFVCDKDNHCLRMIAPGNTVWAVGPITTFCGDKESASGHVDDTGTVARFNQPFGLAFDAAGDLFVADTYNHCIRKVTAAGVVTTFVGTTGTTSGHVDDTGTAARFNWPVGLAFDTAGVLYVADNANNCIRKVTAAGVVTTFVGTTGTTSGHVDDTGTAARFDGPCGLAFDASGNLFVSETSNNCIRKVTAAGVVTTFVGTTGTTSGHVDDTGTAARFFFPQGLVFDATGNLYVSDTNNNCIRKVTPAGVVTTFVGTATGTFSGHVDDTGTAARFWYPRGLVIDGDGNLTLCDSDNHCIRKIDVRSRKVSTYAGTSTTFSGHVDSPDPIPTALVLEVG